MPRPGDRYKSPNSDWTLGPGKSPGGYVNISVTLDMEALAIVNSWPKGVKSERIRYAIKDRHYQRTQSHTEYIEELHANIKRLQERLASEIGQKQMLESNLYTSHPGLSVPNPVKRFVQSALGLVQRLTTILPGRRLGND